MASIKVDLNLDKKLKRTFEEVNTGATMVAIYNTLAKRCDPYVPFLEGPLSQTVEITPRGVRYTQPYARYQYYGDNFKHTLDYHPLASARWDKAMLRDHGDEFRDEIKQIIQWRIQRYCG